MQKAIPLEPRCAASNLGTTMATARKPNRYRTGDDVLDEQLQSILEHVGAERDRDVLFEILVTASLLAGDGADRLDLKLTSAALKEMRAAFRAFAPYTEVAKVTIFGSARTGPGDRSYDQAKELARLMAEADWMVVTGAGPGIMAAGMEGAGREHSFGVNIRLPHEQGANEFIAGDTKLVSMKYFFTRKLMLMKESAGFVSLPGGFGTLDETLELLTLLQTGKADPAPVVLLDRPGGGFWEAFVRFVRDDVLPRGLVDDN
ncbi:MAG: TIGR00730 family Rossman fold protein, partial [Acidimicrobiales bacterium]